MTTCAIITPSTSQYQLFQELNTGGFSSIAFITFVIKLVAFKG
jgi:hypothetical protein